MSEGPPPPLEPRLLALLAAERARPAPPPEVSARVRSALAATLAAPLPDPPASGGPPPTQGLLGALGGLKLPVLLLTFAAGGAAGALGHALLSPPAVQEIRPAPASAAPAASVPRPPDPEASAPPPGAASAAPPGPMATGAPASAAPPGPVAAGAPASPTPSGPVANSAPASAARPGPGSRSADLAAPAPPADGSAERTLIERARSALARREHQAALDALALHRRDFPAGRFLEERRALEVVALAGAGRGEEAKAGAARFRADYPSSLFLPVVEAATR